jgi:hypothetical protein
MANATVPRLDRTARALGIVERAELAPVPHMPGLFEVRDTLTGSGLPHIASVCHCDCFDAQRYAGPCKHQQAVRRAIATTLETEPIADGLWDVVETYTGTLYHVQGSHCDCRTGGDCAHLQAVRKAAHDLVSYAADWDRMVALTQPQCPQCGSALEERSYYVGGRGYSYVQVCSNDASHSSRRG